MDQNLKTIAISDSFSSEMMEALKRHLEEGNCRFLVVGNEDFVKSNLGDIGGYECVSTDEGAALEALQIKRVEAGKKPLNLTNSDLIQALELVQTGEADGFVGGKEVVTAEVLVAASKVIGLQAGVECVSDATLIVGSERDALFGNSALLEEPTAEILADNAVMCGELAKSLGMDPVVALISYQTGEKAPRSQPQKVAEAARLAQARSEWPVEGPFQPDAVMDEGIGATKVSGSQIPGKANVLVFDGVEVGNPAYKIAVQASQFFMGTAGPKAIGPLLLGLNKPANDLSRGSTADEIYETIKVTIQQCV